VEIPDGGIAPPLFIMRLLVLGSIHDTTELKATIAGETLTIRPIRLTDTAMESDFIRGLSAGQTFPLSGAVRELPLDELARLCDVDGKHSMGSWRRCLEMAAKWKSASAAMHRTQDPTCAKSRSLVADEWHHRGVGTLLMKQLIQTARTNGVKQLYSVDLATTPRCARSRGLGMSAARDPDDPRQVIYSLGL